LDAVVEGFGSDFAIFGQIDSLDAGVFIKIETGIAFQTNVFGF